MIEFDEYKVKLSNIRPKLDALADSLGIEAAKEEIDRLHAQIDSEGFWDNQEISQKVMKQSRTLEAKVARYEKMCDSCFRFPSGSPRSYPVVPNGRPGFPRSACTLRA